MVLGCISDACHVAHSVGVQLVSAIVWLDPPREVYVLCFWVSLLFGDNSSSFKKCLGVYFHGVALESNSFMF